MTITRTRREFIRDLGISAAALPFVLNLPSLGFANQRRRKQRLVILFSPDGVVPSAFWPDEDGKLVTLKESLKPLEPFKDRTLVLHGVCDKVRGDGDNHMRGIGCLLTGVELFPGNIQGGSHTPAGWASGISIDQEIKNHLQASPATRTRFGSADFARVATLQYTNSVGNAKMHWLKINEGQHELSHMPDTDREAQDKLTRINKWYCEQLAYLARRLAETPEPGGTGSLLDNTLIVWTNELGKGNSHTLDNIPFVLVGNGLDFNMGRSVKFPKVPHNRLLMSLAHAMGHR